MLFTAKLLTISKSESLNLWCVFPITETVDKALADSLPFTFRMLQTNVRRFCCRHSPSITFDAIVKNSALHCCKSILNYLSLFFRCCCCCYWLPLLLLLLPPCSWLFFVLFFLPFIGLWIHRSFVCESVSICRSNSRLFFRRCLLVFCVSSHGGLLIVLPGIFICHYNTIQIETCPHDEKEKKKEEHNVWKRSNMLVLKDKQNTSIQYIFDRHKHKFVTHTHCICERA